MDDTRGVDDSPIQDNSSRINYDDNFNLDLGKTDMGIPLGLGQDESARYLPSLGGTTPFIPPLPNQSLSSDFPLDPMMRQAFTLPPAGAPTRRVFTELNAQNRKYNMASDIFGTGMDKSWVNEQQNGSTSQSNLGPIAKEPNSFKITQIPSNNPNSTASGEVGIGGNPTHVPNRRARESSGNPLTGAGYDNSTNKTAKRYFEGSNANQKLW